MGESRIELLAWLNDLLQLSYTKIEQTGTGAAACGIVDSIYQDVPMSKVKFNAKHEYEYVANFKVLQEAFKRHKIDKIIPVDRLVKCKMMENLEFLQWMKRYWDLHFPGGEYDALARRRGATAEPNSLISGVGSSHVPPTRAAAPAARAPSAGAAAPVRRAAAPSASIARTAGTAGSAGSSAAVERLTAEISDMRLNLDGLEKERTFYFEKLREIEIIVGARLETEPAPSEEEQEVLKQIQAVLYQTEPGFEIPDVEGEEDGVVDEEETF